MTEAQPGKPGKVPVRRDPLASVFKSQGGVADFSDILLGKINRRKGCSKTITFDVNASRLEEFSIAK